MCLEVPRGKLSLALSLKWVNEDAGEAAVKDRQWPLVESVEHSCSDVDLDMKSVSVSELVRIRIFRRRGIGDIGGQ